jgi:3-phenylpropionate/trans-cinnamate dioxygenase ferredoxin reductase component
MIVVGEGGPRTVAIVKDTFDVLVVGAGHAGLHLASELSAHQYQGRVGVIEAEAEAPYERPPLTKGFLDGSVSVDQLRFPGSFWDESTLRAIHSERVVAVDPERRTVSCASGAEYGYTTMVWAAGGHARQLGIEGEDAVGVHGLRSLAEAKHLKKRISDAHRYVILGGGFIGLEAAAALRKAGVEVTVVEFVDRLLARVTCPTVSDYFLRLHREAGVEVRLGARAVRFEQIDGVLSGVALDSGDVLAADGALVAVGLVPNIGPLVEAGAICGNGVEVDEFGATSLPSVYAVGDCAFFPLAYPPVERMRLESVQNAVDQAKNVAQHIVSGTPTPYRALPWFWSNQYATKFKTVGVCHGYDQTVVRGDVDSGSFAVVYLRHQIEGTQVVAVDAINSMRDYAGGRSLIAKFVDVAALSDASISLASLGKSAS